MAILSRIRAGRSLRPCSRHVCRGPLTGTRTTHTVRCLDSGGVPVRRNDMHADNFGDCYHRFRERPNDDAEILYLWGAVLDARFRQTS